LVLSRGRGSRSPRRPFGPGRGWHGEIKRGFDHWCGCDLTRWAPPGPMGGALRIGGGRSRQPDGPARSSTTVPGGASPWGTSGSEGRAGRGPGPPMRPLPPAGSAVEADGDRRRRADPEPTPVELDLQPGATVAAGDHLDRSRRVQPSTASPALPARGNVRPGSIPEPEGGGRIGPAVADGQLWKIFYNCPFTTPRPSPRRARLRRILALPRTRAGSIDRQRAARAIRRARCVTATRPRSGTAGRPSR
jgi:hypothetical protein